MGKRAASSVYDTAVHFQRLALAVLWVLLAKREKRDRGVDAPPVRARKSEK